MTDTPELQGLLVGKRYQCDACGKQLLVTKAGDGALQCCASPMTLMQPKKTPSSD
jgi:desulfoferrodoxin-like iron-binding protein